MSTTLGNGIFSLQEFYNRGVTKLAPDVLVYIGGSLTTQVLAPVSNRGNGDLTFDDGITSISIQNTTDPPGSSTANIEINTPIYGPNSKYWVPYPDPLNAGAPIKAPLFVPMMEVKIYFKGRYLVKGKPQYYPAFWGLITTIEETYSGGMYKILLGCVDMLHWWAYSTINVHPVPESRIMSGGGQNLTVYATIFQTNNPYNILYTLTTNMGMHEFVTASWVAQKTSINTIYPPKLFQSVTKGIMQYWRQRFANIGNLLKLYGIFGQRVDHNGVQMRVPENTPTDVSKKSDVGQAKQPQDKNQYKVDREYLRGFQVFFDLDKLGTFEKAEYMTKLDIATELKNRCNFEFFQDTNGNFVFKPPFYNMNVKGMLPYTILPSDVISYSMSTNTEEIITVLEVTTPMMKNLRMTSFDQGIGFHMDIELAQRYGIRHKIIPMEYVQDAGMARSLAVGQMNINNARAVTGSVTIPGRPEMRLGYPVYIEHKDSFHYVKSIGHSFEYAGSFSTTLALETERRRIRDWQGSDPSGTELDAAPPSQGITSSELVNAVSNGLVSSSTLNYGWSEPLKDKVYRFKEPTIPNVKSNPNDPPQINVSDTTRQALLMGEFKISSMQQGRYEITDRNKDSDSELAVTQTTVPFTDEDGFQVFGSFPYGRNLNPICISQETVGPPILKNVYLVTMARPIYESESKAMSVLFFDDKEGAVPDPLSGFNIGPQTDTDIATKQKTDAVLTSDQAKQAAKPPPVTAGQGRNIAEAKP